jgi:hypothetical protein
MQMKYANSLSQYLARNFVTHTVDLVGPAVSAVKSRRLQWAQSIGQTEETRNAPAVLLGKILRNTLGGPTRK